MLSALLSALLVVAGLVYLTGTSQAATGQTIFGATTTGINVDPDTTKSVIGTQFKVARSGTVKAVQVHRSPNIAGPLTAKLARGGTVLATVSLPAAPAGWQQVDLAAPVAVAAGQTYTVFYTAPAGRYSVRSQYNWPKVSGDLTAVRGVYTFGTGVPTSVYNNENYWVDVVFSPTSLAPTASPTSSTSITPPSPPSPPSPSPSTSASPTTSTMTSLPTQPAVLDLPRVPWDGGPAYWAQFPNAKRAGWDKDTFLPILAWYGSCSPEQYTFDKSMGLNGYAQCNPDTTYAGVKTANMFTLFPTVGQPTDGTQTQQVGTLLDDEVDGRYSTADGLAHMRKLAEQYGVANTGGFTYSNWTSGIVTYDRSMQFSTDYYNTVDVNSIDAYLLSVPQCDWMNGTTWVGSRFRTPAVSSLSSGQAGTPITQTNCRSASSYGKLVDLEHEINAARSKHAPIWGVPEVLSTGGSVGGYKQPTPAEVKAAAFNSVIHEARGLVWFSQAPDQTSVNDCITGDAFRDARLDPTACSAKNVRAVGEVNLFLTSLAPVINTQSFVWNFGTGIDSMLKVKDNAAYIFAMAKDAGSGQRTFTLPAGVTGTTVEVVGESRSIPISGGKFIDSFADASAYHVYRITL